MAADIKMSREHGYGKDGARERCERMIGKFTEKFGLKTKWDGDVCKFSGPAEGALTVTDKTVDIEVKLGFAAKMLKKTIEEQLGKQLDRMAGGGSGEKTES